MYRNSRNKDFVSSIIADGTQRTLISIWEKCKWNIFKAFEVCGTCTKERTEFRIMTDCTKN